jgi:hypothetical protein
MISRMQLAQCPGCNRSILAPASRLPATARCPECSHEFELERVAERDVLVADIVSRASAVSETAATTISNGVPDAGSKLDIDLRNLTSTGAAQRPTRRRRRWVWEVMKPVLGGLAGLVIAQLILWWLPGGLRRDPLELAPRLPPQLAFMAPEGLRQHKLSEASPAKSASAVSSSRLPTDNLPRTDNLPPTDNLDLSRIGLNSDERGPADVVAAVDTTTASDRSSPGPLNGPRLSRDEFHVILTQTREADQEFDASRDPAAAAHNRKQFYIRMAELARAVTAGDRESADRESADWVDVLTAVEDLLHDIGHSPLKRKVLGVGTAGWIGYEQRTTTGIALAGTVRGIASQGSVYECQIELSGKPGSFVDALIASDPREDGRARFDIGDEVIALATIVDDPTEQIAGYTGNRHVMAWIGLHVVVPRP